jgi:polysaccharide biosynthesis transport protein
VELRRQLAIIRAWLPLVVAGALLAAGAAFVVSSMQTKVYEAKATLIVGQSLSAVNPDYNQLLASQRLSTTYAIVATTRPILDSVIKELGLTTSAQDLRSRIVADTPQSNSLLTITARDADPDQAAAIANALADQLIAASPAIQGRQAEFQSSIDEDLKATQDQITATQARVDALVALPDRTAEQDAALATLEDRLVSLRSTYATLLSYSSGGSNLLTVVEPAVAPASPVSPKPLLYALLSGIVGLLLVTAIVFMVEYFDDRIKDSDDAQEAVGLPTLGSIARMKGGRGRSEIYRLVTILYPRSATAEAYRTLRTNVEFASLDGRIRSLVVTSSMPGEGKTVTAANLAAVFAQAGRRVLLVDADLRKPGIHLLFDVPNIQGLTTLLRTDEVTFDVIAHSTEQANLRVLSTGPLPPNPAELLGSQRMGIVLDRIMAGIDMVIFDSPPVGVVTDPAILSARTDATLFVVDVGHSRRGAVRQGREALAKAGANVIGVVLNRIPVGRRAGSANYYDAAYYGATYGSDDGAEKLVDVTQASPTKPVV